MTFQAPEWFFLIPVMAVAGWYWRRLRIFSPLRSLFVIVLAFLLAHPVIHKQEKTLDLYVLLDRSDSTESLVDQGLPEWKKLLEKYKPTKNDTLHFYNYGAEVAELGYDGDVFTGSRKLTRSGLAMQMISAIADEKRPSRVLLFTDGFATEPLYEAAAQLSARGIPLDYRLIREPSDDDFRVARLTFPERVQVGEPFLLGVTVRGAKDGAVPLKILRNKVPLMDASVQLTNGVGQVEFTDRLTTTGSYNYEARISPANDKHIGNNAMNRVIEITGGPRVLLVTKYENDPAAAVLRARNFTVEIVIEPNSLTPNKLSGARAVMINNVPAHEVPSDFLAALNFYVHEQGGGFLMAGGERSFGSGGYFQSSIDSLLPISMELKSEQRKLSVALAIVIDRSGSMSVNVSPGVKKIDMANQGAANAINLLGVQDQVAVYAVDSAPEEIIPMTQLKDKQKALSERAKKITSSGGGIFVYEGLKAGWEALKKTNSGTRHLILFSDASDSEEPGDYINLLKEMTDQGATVSVIGLGTDKDCDSALLKDVAALGKGRIFFSDKPQDIPNIFSQETVTIARSSFIKDPVKTKETGRWADISPNRLAWLDAVDGYNLSYAREDATVSLASADEYVAPLVATARRGLGRTAAVSFPLGGKFSQRVRDWQGYGDFMQTLTRWLMGMEAPAGIAVRHKTDGTRLTIDLLYDTELWAEKLNGKPPLIKLLESGGVPYDVSWRRISPGHFSVTREMNEGTSVRGAIQVGEHALSFGPVTLGSSVEWSFEPERLTELRAVSAQTGGRELLDLSQAWQRPTLIHEANLRIPLGISALVLLLLDALFTRTGWKMPTWERAKKAPPIAKKSPAPQPQPLAPAAEKTVSKAPEKSPPPLIEPEAESDTRRSRFQRAKDRKH